MTPETLPIKAPFAVWNAMISDSFILIPDFKMIEIIRQDVLERKRLKGRTQMITALSKSRIDTLKVASQVLSQAIPLERKAYSLDTDLGEAMSIRYVVPDIKKPAWSGLSEDQWG